MFPPFEEELAFSELKKLISQLNLGTIALNQISKPSQERNGNGIMLGAMIALDTQNNKKVLITVSGLGHKIDFNDERIFVQPIVDIKKINDALQKNDKEIHILTNTINKLKNENTDCKDLLKQRLTLCNESLLKVYELYYFCCSDGKTRSLLELCESAQQNYAKIDGTNSQKTTSLPPTGTGDCCAPKLLHYAYSNNLKPISMCEVFYKKNTVNNNKLLSEKSPPCDHRCSLILPGILGLRILYRDEHIIVVNKQSGLLSVPGRGPEKQDCIVNRVKKLFPNCIEQPAVHRLDMETSGILILAFTKEAHRILNKEFEDGIVEKKYCALLDGNLLAKNISKHGKMELYFRLDINNRPHQIWDKINGKKAITEWHIENVERYTTPNGITKNVTRVTFIPHTGRTHQLRLASADSHGFGIPIIGDTLYGNCIPGERLLLHATDITFTHPITMKKITIHCPAEF